MAKTWNEETEKNIQGVVNEKSKWQAAYDAGDEEGMKAAQEVAKGYYNNLTASGNYDVAKELQQSDYDTARGYFENYKGTKPSDTNRGMALENTRTATDTVKKQSDFADRSADAIFEGYEDQKDKINANPMETDAAKAIMDRYRGLGEEARGDTLADGSVRNDGNLDSFTKANADRQRQAYEDAGVESVFDLHDRNIEHGGQNYRDLQSGIGVANGVYNDTVANANVTAESATNIENANRQSDAEITGEVPEALRKEGNVFFNADGTLKNPEWDFQAIINEATARGDMETVRQAEEARLWKVQNVKGYEEYAPTVKVPEAQQTEAARQFDESVRVSEKEIDTNAALEREQTVADLFAEAAKYEAMGMPKVAESIRKYAAGKSEDEDEVAPAAQEEPTGSDDQGNLKDNEDEEQLDAVEWEAKKEIISEILKAYPPGKEREAELYRAGITFDDIDRYNMR